MSDKEIIHPPNNLRKAKIGEGPGKLDPELLKRAEKAVAKMSQDYTTWAAEDLTQLEARLASLRKDGADTLSEFKEIFRLALDMKGQGGSFGYLLITAIADSLVKFVEDRTKTDGIDLEVIAAHLGAMRAVFSEEVLDDGGPVGEQLMDGLFRLKVKAAS